MMLVIGINTRMIRKYKMEASWPMMMNGCSTGCPPIHVSVMRSATSIGIDLVVEILCLVVWMCVVWALKLGLGWRLLGPTLHLVY